MNWFDFLMGVSFILIGIILLIIQIRRKGYQKLANWGDIMQLFGGIFCIIGGLIYVINSF